MKQGDKTKSDIIKVASTLFYQRGFANAAISDIVDQTGLSKGNITYHFKSKDDILHAVMEYRRMLALEGFAEWERECDSPQECLSQYVDSLADSKSELVRFGCRNGSLASELGKHGGSRGQLGSSAFDATLGWLSRQFELSGASSKLARELGVELMIRGQGICLLSQAYHDEKLFLREVGKLRTWLGETTVQLVTSS